MLAHQRAVTAQARNGPSSSKHKQAAAISCRAQSSPRPTSKHCHAAAAVTDRILSGMGAAVIAAGLALAPMPALAAQQTLADLVRGDFAFVDVNGDGSITRWAEEGLGWVQLPVVVYGPSDGPMATTTKLTGAPLCQHHITPLTAAI